MKVIQDYMSLITEMKSRKNYQQLIDEIFVKAKRLNSNVFLSALVFL